MAKEHKSHKLDTRYVRETVKYHLIASDLPNGRTWYIYVPKNPRKTNIVYAGSFKTPDFQLAKDPPSNDCTCTGAHYHAPPIHKYKPPHRKPTKKR